jgi:hypothetical protein
VHLYSQIRSGSDGFGIRVEGVDNNTQPSSSSSSSSSTGGLNEFSVDCDEDVMRLLSLALRNRTIGVATAHVRAHSARSHLVLTCRAEGRNAVARTRYFGKLHLVDLAGSECLTSVETAGSRMVETQVLNMSFTLIDADMLTLMHVRVCMHACAVDSQIACRIGRCFGWRSATVHIIMFIFLSLEPTRPQGEEAQQAEAV